MKTIYTGLGAVEFVTATIPADVDISGSTVQLAVGGFQTPSAWTSPDALTFSTDGKTATAKLKIGNGHTNPVAGLYYLWYRVVDTDEIVIAPIRGVRFATTDTTASPIPAVPPYDLQGAAATAAVAAQVAAQAYSDTHAAPATVVIQGQQYKTTADQVSLFATVTPAPFAAIANPGPADIIVSPGERAQPFIGVGAALTDASLTVMLNYLSVAQRTALLTELFAPGPTGCGWSTVRIGIGSSCYGGPAYTYDDQAPGVTDNPLTSFSIDPDQRAGLVAVLQQILAINPKVRIIATAWTPPAFMKTGANPILQGGTMNNTAPVLTAYANYLVKFVQAYTTLGIPIWAVSPQNEPTVNGTAYSTCAWASADYTTFVGTYLGPAFDTAGISSKIFVNDDNWNNPTIATNVVADATAGPYVNGIAWHGYGGIDTVMKASHLKNPNKSQHITEWRTFATDNFAAALLQMTGGLAASCFRNGGQSLTLWNLALDQNGNPALVTPARRPVITVPNDSSGTIVRNAEYYMLTHIAKYAQPGAQITACTSFGGPYTVGTPPTTVRAFALLNPDQSVVLVVCNANAAAQTFQIIDSRTNKGFPVTMASGEVSTFVWGNATKVLPAGTSPATTVPNQPTLVVTPGTAANALSWSAPTSASPVTGYVISRSRTTGTEKEIVRLPSTASSYTDPSGNGTFFYTLQALNSYGTSVASAEQSGTATAPTPVKDAVSTGATAGNANTLSWSHTTGALTHGLLLVAVALAPGSVGNPTLGSVTYGGWPMTLIGRANSAVGAGTQRLIEFWAMTQPPAGAATLLATVSGGGSPTATMLGEAITYSGVNPRFAYGEATGTPQTFNAASSNAPSIVTSGGQPNDIVLAAVSARTTVAPTPGGGQTSQESQLNGSNLYGVLTSQAGGTGNITSSFTWTTADQTAAIAVAIHGG